MRLLPLLLAVTLPMLAAEPSSKGRVPVLVELFTSEGCSSCPPADALLARLDREQPVAGAEIIALGEHVDYWDQLGWRDRFSSSAATARQSGYSARFGLDSVYTPQMVVDGRSQFVGNDPAAAARAIAAAATLTKLPLLLSVPMVEGRRFTATVTLEAGSTDADGDLFVALIDPMDTTEVRRGENGGRTLRHVSVVRSLTRIGRVRDLAKMPLTFTAMAPDASVPGAMRLIVFAQSRDQGAVLGVASSAAAGRAQAVSATVKP